MLARIACTQFYLFLVLSGMWLLTGRQWAAVWTFLVGTFLYLGFMVAHLWSTRPRPAERR